MNQEIKKRTKWFMDARFGMFIHWGLYAIPACGEWMMSEKEMPASEYEKYFYMFDPVDFNPRQWAKLAKKAGMKYAVLTAKHHDGFCLFDSALTDYKATNTKAGRDLVREFLDAFREEEIKTGLYFSIIDWHHPDFPKYGDRQHPMRNCEAYRDEKINFDRYLEYMHGQVKELVTGYGKLDILWFDFSYDDMCGEKWKATELIKMVRKYQPDVIIDNRLEGGGGKHGSIATENPLIYSGDFASPEQIIPPCGVRNEKGEMIPWELCATMNNHWGYCNFDYEYKPAGMLIRKLVECVSKGGNMLLMWGLTRGEGYRRRVLKSWRKSAYGWKRTVKAFMAAASAIFPSRNGEDTPRRAILCMPTCARRLWGRCLFTESGRTSRRGFFTWRTAAK